MDILNNNYKEKNNMLMSAQDYNKKRNRIITGFYFFIQPYNSPYIPLSLIRNAGGKEKLIETIHYLLRQVNCDWDLQMIKSYRIDVNTLRKATEEEIKKYYKDISEVHSTF